MNKEPGKIDTEEQEAELPYHIHKIFQGVILVAQSQMPANKQSTVPLAADTSGPVINLHQVTDRDMYLFSRIDHFRFSPPQAGLCKISNTRNTEDQNDQVNGLPQHAVAIQPDTGYTQHEQNQMECPHLTGQTAIPLQCIFQPHTNSRDQDQCQQSGESQTTDDRNSERGTDRTGIFRISHCQRKHSHDGRDRSDQDRTDTRQACRHQRPVPPVPLLTENIGIIDQNDTVIYHHSQQDQESCQRIRIQQTVIGQQQSQQGTDGCQRNREKQYKRCHERFEDRSQYHKDQNKSCQYQELEIGKLILLMEDLYGDPCRQVIIGNQLVDIRTVSFQQVFRRFHIFGEVIENFDLLVLIDTHDTGASPSVIDRCQILQVMQATVGILYLHTAQIVDSLFFPGSIGIFLFCLFQLLLFFGDIVTDDDIIGILSYLEGSTGRIFGIERSQPG